MSLMDIVKPLKDYLGLDPHQIDNLVFRLHSKLTVIILGVFSLIVTAQQFIGDPIDCIVHADVPGKLMDTYCWIHSTFTLPNRIFGEQVNSPSAHPGVGNPAEGEETITHKYYQWVCFTLLLQSLMFYVPRFIWNTWEGSRIKTLIPEAMVYKVDDARMPLFPKPRGLLTDVEVDGHVQKMVTEIIGAYGQRRLAKNRNYFWRFQFCEWLNLLHVIFQIFFIDLFLGGMFTTYGNLVWSMSNMDPEDRSDPMNLVFPKVTKCTFRKMGPSGTIQIYDGLCVLPINIINEKIYIFMWYWFIFLAVVSALFQVYRLATLFLPSVRSYSLFLYTQMHPDVKPEVTDRLISVSTPGEWFLLCQLGANLDPHIFAQLLIELDKHLKTTRGSNMNGRPVRTADDKIDKIA